MRCAQSPGCGTTLTARDRCERSLLYLLLRCVRVPLATMRRAPPGRRPGSEDGSHRRIIGLRHQTFPSPRSSTGTGLCVPSNAA
jgi:hypothetical protein